MDSYLGIMSLGLGIAALVPILLPSTRVRLWTLTAAGLSILILIGAYQAYKSYTETRAIRNLADEILQQLDKTEKGMSFDQLVDNLYYPNFNQASDAVDELVFSKQIESDKVNVSDGDGTKYIIRRFYRTHRAQQSR